MPQLHTVSIIQYLTHYLKHSLSYALSPSFDILRTISSTRYLTHCLKHSLSYALSPSLDTLRVISSTLLLQCHNYYLTYLSSHSLPYAVSQSLTYCFKPSLFYSATITTLRIVVVTLYLTHCLSLFCTFSITLLIRHFSSALSQSLCSLGISLLHCLNHSAH